MLWNKSQKNADRIKDSSSVILTSTIFDEMSCTRMENVEVYQFAFQPYIL